MAQNFYKKDGSYYLTTGQKVLNLAELQGYAKAGGKEISAPAGSPAAPVKNKFDVASSNPASVLTKKQELDIAASRVAAGTGSAIDKANLAYAGDDYSAINSINEANQAINGGQQADAEEIKTEEVPTRKTLDDVISEIETKITPEEKRPKADFTETLEEYRTQYGVSGMEDQLNELRAEEEELAAIKRERVAAEREKPVAMNVIEGRVGQAERQENERIAVVQRSINNITNQLNTKYNIINTLMKTKEMDYSAAVESYDKEMQQNVSIFNAARGILEDEKSEIEKQIDNARSNAQISLNAYTSQGLTYDELSPAEQTNLTKLGVQSGLGADFFVNALKVSTGKDILTTITSADDTKATIIYKDGTTKTIATGLPARKTGTSETKATESEIKVFYKQSMETELKKIVGDDGYISPSDWAKAKRKWTANTPYGAADFDDTYKGYINPAHPSDYSGFENYKAGMLKKSSAELEMEGLE